MSLVLLIEDEPALRVNMARGLGKLPGTKVLDVGHLRDALRVIDATPPDMIISDIDLPGRSGLELLSELESRHLRIPVLFVSAYVKSFGALIPNRNDVEVIEKPVSLEDLRSHVRKRFKSSAPPVSHQGVPDFVQLAVLGRHSVRMDCLDARRRRLGVVVFSRGALWYAEDLEGQGEQAFARLCHRGDLQVTCVAVGHEPGPRNVHRAWDVILEDAPIFAAESGVHFRKARLSTIPPPGGVIHDPLAAMFPDHEAFGDWDLTSATDTSDDEVDALFVSYWDEAVVAMVAHDYDAALNALLRCAALHPHDQAVQANLARIASLQSRSASNVA